VKSFSTFDREQTIQKMKNNESHRFDLLIVGGGITGAGVARDAASRGMSVALIERNDFAFGSSSRTTKLIHGGLRYLENLEFGLVFEALSERQLLFEIAPHLVHPLRFMLPIYDDSRVGMFKMGCGMWLYDILACFRGGQHEALSRQEVFARVPFLKRDGLKGAYVYSDAYMDDDRLVLETLRSANELGAQCVNYVTAEKPVFDDGQVVGMTCKNMTDGSTWVVHAKHVISTVGPWTDDFGAKIFSDWKKLLKPSKGIHLTLPRHRFPIEDAVVLSDEQHGRIIFAVPRSEMVIVGTTDSSYSGDPADVCATDEDVHYLNKMLNQYFPAGHFSLDDYVSSYAGIRPLVASGEEGVGKTSREHTILDDPRGVTFVAGGKYTTYRAMAEEVVDHALQSFSLAEVGQFTPSQTKSVINPQCSVEAISRSRQMLSTWASETSSSLQEMQLAWARHGEEALDVRKRAPSFWAAEASFAVENTMCMNLVDFYTRRTPLFLAEEDHGLTHMQDISEVFADSLGWSRDETDSQSQRVRAHIKSELKWKVPAS